MATRRPQEYEMCSNSERAALNSVLQNGTDIIMEVPSVPENGAPKIGLKEVTFIFLRELFGMRVYTFVASMSGDVGLSLGLIYAALQASAEMSGSGGVHLNPAITLGVAISGRMKPILILPMIFGQFIGCLLGPAFCLVEDVVELIKYCFGEFLITAILVTVFLRLFPLRTKRLPAIDKERQETENRKYIHALFVGLTIIALTGVVFQVKYIGLMNPFQAFGHMAVWVTVQQSHYHSLMDQLPLPDHVKYGDSNSSFFQMWEGHWVYWVRPIVGGILAGVVDRLKGHCQRYPIE